MLLRRTRRGVTLVELEVILVVFGLLAAIGAYGFFGLYDDAESGRAHDVLAHVAAGQQAHYTARGVFVGVGSSGDQSAAQQVAEHEAGYVPADTEPGADLRISLGQGHTSAGVPYIAAATTVGDLCAMRVDYPPRAGIAAATAQFAGDAVACTAAEAAARLAG